MTSDEPVVEAIVAAGPDGLSPGSRAVRVWGGSATDIEGDPTIVVGVSTDDILVDGEPAAIELRPGDGRHATLLLGRDRDPADAADHAEYPEQTTPRRAVRLTLGAVERRAGDAVGRREVVVDGWRVVVESEPEARAALRERARRGRSERVAGGPVHVRAIIPGRIVALNVAPGDDVTAGQQLLVLEAMKMQNELRAPRDGTIDRVAVGVGVNVEVGDLLLVIR